MGALVVLVIAALAVTVALGILRGALAPVDDVDVDDPTSTVAAVAEQTEVYVHVSGSVASPGLYVLAEDARVVDAIAAAGGFGTDADTAAVNLARTLADGEQLHVPRMGEVPAPPVGGASGGAAPGASAGGAGQPGGLVNLNTAAAAELETLPRIGPAMAERIIAWRDENGGFTTVEDLLAVPGIGDKMLESLRDLVTV